MLSLYIHYRYFTGVFVAQLALATPSSIPGSLCKSVNHFLTEFLATATYEQIRDSEIKHWYVWQTFVPYVKLAYFANPAHHQLSTDIRTMQTLSLRLIIFGLQNMLGREKHREVLVQENLLDYVVCMPWFVPEPLKQQARDLVAMLASSPDINMQPPRLLSVTKALLAKSCPGLGLEKVVKLSAGEIATQLLPNTEKLP